MRNIITTTIFALFLTACASQTSRPPTSLTEAGASPPSKNPLLTEIHAEKGLGRCGFDARMLAFRGTAIEQTKCLLSPVSIGGAVGSPLKQLPSVLEARVGQAAMIDKQQLKALLLQHGLAQLAGGLERPVSRTPNGTPARYFVIHDISQKLAGNRFPPDEADSLNRLGYKNKDGDWVAHIFLNRRGEIFVGHDFDKPWRATQLESNKNGAGIATRGLFLHIEHNQPRLRDPAVSQDNDRIAPRPGFTSAQYDRLALLYLVASARRGAWLIPAYHAVLDSGVVGGGHDDPQNFELQKFTDALERFIRDVERSDATASFALPADTDTQRTLRATLYYTALENDYPAGNDVVLKTKAGALIARISKEFNAKAGIEGSAKLSDGRVINVDGRIDGERRWKVVANDYGLDALGCPLVPFRSAAVDMSVVPKRARLFLAETVGMQLPSGGRHDGIWYAVDTGKSIEGDRIDLFVGAGKASMAIAYKHGISHLKPLSTSIRGSVSGCTRS